MRPVRGRKRHRVADRLSNFSEKLSDTKTPLRPHHLGERRLRIARRHHRQVVRSSRRPRSRRCRRDDASPYITSRPRTRSIAAMNGDLPEIVRDLRRKERDVRVRQPLRGPQPEVGADGLIDPDAHGLAEAADHQRDGDHHSGRQRQRGAWRSTCGAAMRGASARRAGRRCRTARAAAAQKRDAVSARSRREQREAGDDEEHGDVAGDGDAVPRRQCARRARRR